MGTRPRPPQGSNIDGEIGLSEESGRSDVSSLRGSDNRVCENSEREHQRSPGLGARTAETGSRSRDA